MQIKHGTTRIVFLVGNYAIKFPTLVEWRLFLQGLLANMVEARFSPIFPDKLCPVVFSIPGGFMTVMKRCRDLSREEFYEGLVELEDWPIPVELKIDSVGWLDGRIVAVDYGN